MTTETNIAFMGIDIDDNKVITIRHKKTVVVDGEEFPPNIEAKVYEPLKPISEYKETYPEVVAMANVMWTDDVIESYKKLHAEQNQWYPMP